VETLDYLPGDEAGIKSVTLLIKGDKAYGYLKAEKGIHRLVRISPFDSSGRRHTSFAAVDVLPEISDDSAESIVLNPDDLKNRYLSFRRRRGTARQQNRLRGAHHPSSFGDRGAVPERALSKSPTGPRRKKILKAKLLDRRRQEQEQELINLRGDQQDIAWGSQIRSYVFHPYSLVKDHRTKAENGNVQSVMDGDITGFMEAWLKAKAEGLALAATDDTDL